MKVHISPCSPQKSSKKEAVFLNSKAIKQDKTKLKEFAPEIQSSRCTEILLFKCNFLTSNEFLFSVHKLRLC